MSDNLLTLGGYYSEDADEERKAELKKNVRFLGLEEEYFFRNV